MSGQQHTYSEVESQPSGEISCKGCFVLWNAGPLVDLVQDSIQELHWLSGNWGGRVLFLAMILPHLLQG
jgi:hypothetical protein